MLFGSVNLSGQILDNSRGMLAVEDVLFRKEFLVRNDIAEIRETHQVKPPGQSIKNRPDQAIMTFDTSGRLKGHFRISSASGRSDTIHRTYTHGPEGLTRMLQIRGDQVHEEFLLSRGDTLYIRNNRLERPTSSEVQTEDLIWMYDEKLAINKTGRRTEYLRYNNEGKPYLRTVIRQDSTGLLLEEREEFVVTHQTRTTTFTYNKYGLVAEREEQLANGGKKRWEFQYDEHFNAVEVKYFRNETYKWRMEFLYTPMGLLDATLTQQQDTKNIDIVRYSYQFHSNTGK
jgi:hypothetical protein